MAVHLFYFFIFPGLLFVAITGAFLSWFDRKIILIREYLYNTEMK